MVNMHKPIDRRVSTRYTRMGAMIEDTYNAFRCWDVNKSVNENAEYIFKTNAIGAKSEGALHHIKTDITSRFGPGPTVEPLVILAKANYPMDKWKYCLQWHIAQVDELYFQFTVDWLFKEYERGAYILRARDVLPYIISHMVPKIAKGQGISEYSQGRLAQDLFKMAAQFSQLKGNVEKRFNPHKLPDDVFLYVAHALWEQSQSAKKVIAADEWKIYLMSSKDVENTLLDLHQYKQLHYDAAGSVHNLELPCSTLKEYAERISRHG